MPKKTKKRKVVKRKSSQKPKPRKGTKKKSLVKKKTSPVKSKVHNNILLLKKLEEKLSILTERIRKTKNGAEAKLSFFINSNNELEGYLIYRKDKIFYWGKLEGKTFVFDRGVPFKFLPKGQERIDLSDTI